MIPQGTAVINTAYFDNIIDQLNGLSNLEQEACAYLQQVIEQVFADIEAQIQSLLDKLQKLIPPLEIFPLPQSLQDLITWAEKVAKSIAGPALAAYATVVINITLIATKVAEIQQAIQSVLSNGLNCSPNIPSFTMPSIPQLPAGIPASFIPANMPPSVIPTPPPASGGS